MADPIELRPLGASKPPLPPRHPEARGATDPAPATTGSLHAAYRSAEERAKAAVHLQEGSLDEVSIWGLAASAWFAVLAVPLLLFPRLLVFFAQSPPPSSLFVSSTPPDRTHYDALTPLESFLCLSLSTGLLALALLILLCLVPTYPAATPSPNLSANPHPVRARLLGILVGLTTIMSVLGWDTKRIGGLGVLVGGGNAVVAVWGWWCIVFGQGGSRLANVGKAKGKKHVPERFKHL